MEPTAVLDGADLGFLRGAPHPYSGVPDFESHGVLEIVYPSRFDPDLAVRTRDPPPDCAPRDSRTGSPLSPAFLDDVATGVRPLSLMSEEGSPAEPSPALSRPARPQVSFIGDWVVMDEVQYAPVDLSSDPSSHALRPVSPAGALVVMGEVEYATVEPFTSPSSPARPLGSSNEGSVFMDEV